MVFLLKLTTSKWCYNWPNGSKSSMKGLVRTLIHPYQKVYPLQLPPPSEDPKRGHTVSKGQSQQCLWCGMKASRVETPEESVHGQWAPETSYGTHPQTHPARNQPTQQEESPEETPISPLCQRSVHKGWVHLLPPWCQGDLQVGTHPEAIPDEG